MLKSFIYILIEHQSEKNYNMPLRLFDYSARIWTHYVKKKAPESSRKSFKYPQIIPVVFYTGEGSWTVEKNIGDKILCVEELKEYIPMYRYITIELSRLDQGWLKEVEGILSRVLFFMNIRKDMVPEELEEFVKILNRSPYAEKIRRYLTSMLVAEGLAVSEAEEVVRSLVEGEVEGMIRMLREARVEGRKEGRIEGAIESKREDILEILEERFGQVPKDIEEAIEKIDGSKRLSYLLRKSVVVKALEDLRKLLRDGK